MTGDWRPIETAPKDGTRVLVFSDEDGIAVVEWNGVNWFSPLYDMSGVNDPTHWMPLPEAPKSAV